MSQSLRRTASRAPKRGTTAYRIQTNHAFQTLLARNYRGDIPMSAVENFPILLSEAEEESSAVPPCFSHEGINVSCLASSHIMSRTTRTAS